MSRRGWIELISNTDQSRAPQVWEKYVDALQSHCENVMNRFRDRVIAAISEQNESRRIGLFELVMTDGVKQPYAFMEVIVQDDGRLLSIGGEQIWPRKEVKRA